MTHPRADSGGPWNHNNGAPWLRNGIGDQELPEGTFRFGVTRLFLSDTCIWAEALPSVLGWWTDVHAPSFGRPLLSSAGLLVLSHLCKDAPPAILPPLPCQFPPIGSCRSRHTPAVTSSIFRNSLSTDLLFQLPLRSSPPLSSRDSSKHLSVPGCPVP